MCLKIYYVHRGLWDVRGNVFLAVEGCLKVFGGAFSRVFTWSFSMLSASHVLSVAKPDWRVLNFDVVNGVFFFGRTC